MRKPKPYYIEAKGRIVRVEAEDKRSAMTAFHLLGYLVVWKDVKVIPAWEEDRKENKNKS